MKIMTMSDPRWKQLLLESLSTSMKDNKDCISYCLSTISRKTISKPTSGRPIDYEYRPESRTVVHRGFVNERRSEDDLSTNSIELGSGDSLLICTDLRSPKVDQILDHQPSSSPDLQSGSPASICWWFPPTGEQYRIQAKAYVVPPSSASSRIPNISKEQADRLSPLWKHHQRQQTTKSDQLTFDWEKERRRIFEKLSTELKFSFLGQYKPGSKLLNHDDPTRYPSQHQQQSSSQSFDQLDQDSKSFALSNFALIVLDPISVDLVRLKTEPHQRFSWTRGSDDNEWEETELIP